MSQLPPGVSPFRFFAFTKGNEGPFQVQFSTRLQVLVFLFSDFPSRGEPGLPFLKWFLSLAFFFSLFPCGGRDSHFPAAAQPFRPAFCLHDSFLSRSYSFVHLQMKADSPKFSRFLRIRPRAFLTCSFSFFFGCLCLRDTLSSPLAI